MILDTGLRILDIIAIVINMFRLAGEYATVKIPLSPFCKGGTQTRLKSHELTHSDNEAYRCKAFPPLKRATRHELVECGDRGDLEPMSNGTYF